ncbi:MAG: hypothetical protein KDB68_12695 [Planctomycetes bacterium]|nr:hypothetical protein [Planctomycetota bacterium]
MVGTAVAAVVLFLSSMSSGDSRIIVEKSEVVEAIPAQTQWVSYNDVGNMFTARFPSRPNFSTSKIETRIGQRVLHRASIASGPTRFAIEYFDIESARGGYSVTFIDGLLDYARSLNAIVLDAHEFVVQRQEGVTATLLMPDGSHTHAVHIHAERHYYMLLVENAPPESKGDFNYFVQSFTLSDTALRIAPLTISGPDSSAGWADAAFAFKWQSSIKITGGRKPYSFTISPPLPDGLTAYGSTEPPTSNGQYMSNGSISVAGVTSHVGRFPFTVSVIDDDGRAALFETELVLAPLPDTLGHLAVSTVSNSHRNFEVPPDLHFRVKPFQRLFIEVYHVPGGKHIPLEYEWSYDRRDLPYDFGNLPKEMSYSNSKNLSLGGLPVRTGEFDVPVSCTVKVQGSDRVEVSSLTVTIEVLPLEPSEIPESAGSIPEPLGIFEGSMVRAYLRLDVIGHPVLRTGQKWPAKITWSWDELSLPKGMAITADEDPREPDLFIYGAAKEVVPGTYEIVVTCTVELLFVEQPYEVTRTVTFNVTE